MKWCCRITINSKPQSELVGSTPSDTWISRSDTYHWIDEPMNQVSIENLALNGFDGDDTLAIILSKAFMLADDDKIKDASINSQIRGGAPRP
jgi:hypothetical protein